MTNAQRVLDIGAGVGREALELAAMGKEVVACDPSKESLRILEEEAARRNLLAKVQTRVLPASRIRELEAEFGGHSFEGCYSSFALHYEPTMRGIPEGIWTLLRPGSPCLLSILNRICLMEMATLIPILLPRRGFLRLMGEFELSVDGVRVLAKTYGPSEVIDLFGSCFSFEGARALSVLLPPHYLARLLGYTGALKDSLERLNDRASTVWPFKYLGSSTAYLFRSRPSPIRTASES